MAERKFLDFLDRIDGGGAGQSGDQFEGGGLLSLLGNLAAGITPYGSEDERRAAARRKFYESQSGMDAPMPTTAGKMAPRAASMATTGASLAQMPSPDNFYNNPNQTRAVPSTFYNNPNQAAPAPAPMPNTFYNNPNYSMPAPLDAGGNYVGPGAVDDGSRGFQPSSYTGVGAVNDLPVSGPGLSFEQFVAGLGPIAQTASPDALRQAYVQQMQQYAY